MRSSTLAILIALQPASAFAAAPILYDEKFFESPVRGAPDDLLLLAGRGFSTDDLVVYVRINNTTLPLTPPASVPGTSTAITGIAPVKSYKNVPDSLTVRLPTILTPGASYALFVKNGLNQWSNGVLINDARPLWITPRYVYRSTPLSSLPRQLKVVGRNLERKSASTPTKVRLTGPVTLIIDALDDLDPTTHLEHYAAIVPLPTTMAEGSYAVHVSRDGGTSWVASPASFFVRPNLPVAPSFTVASFGCTANDGLDDTRCFVRALNAANAVQGTVEIGPGTWDLAPSTSMWTILKTSYPALVSDEYGLKLPSGVSLHGAGSQVSSVVKSASWPAFAVFTLIGSNRVQHTTWKDDRVYGPTDTSTFFQLGIRPWVDPSVTLVADLVFDNNVFVRPYIAIGTQGVPIADLIITDNHFAGAYFVGLDLGGNQYVLDKKFHVDNAIIRDNVFSPGDYVDACAHQGTIGSSSGASARLDMSDNDLDGQDSSYLRDPSQPGWRAGSFFHMQGNHEGLLVARNSFTCTGNKAGDGEAIAYDANLDAMGYKDPPLVTASTPDSVTVQSPLLTKHTSSYLALPAGYFDEHWLVVGNGPGVGQARKISSITTTGLNVVFRISPAWDVQPVAGSSKITVTRMYWQAHTVDNLVDERSCAGVNQNGLKNAGTLSYYGATADSSFAGNQLYDTGGIIMPVGFGGYEDPANYFYLFAQLSYFNEVRGNSIIGEGDYDSGCSSSGLQMWFGGSAGTSMPPDQVPVPIVLGYGLQLAHNTITRADGLRGGAITFPQTWWEPAGSRMWLNTLVHHNTMSDLPNTPITTTTTDQCTGLVNCEQPPHGSCVNIQPLVHDTVLYANTCPAGATPLIDQGTDTTP